MTIILDLDDVLFDTLNFKKSLARIFKKFGADFYGTYDNAHSENGTYSLKRHLILIKKENKKIDIKKSRKT